MIHGTVVLGVDRKNKFLHHTSIDKRECFLFAEDEEEEQ
jgi:hypothetical protein